MLLACLFSLCLPFIVQQKNTMSEEYKIKKRYIEYINVLKKKPEHIYFYYVQHLTNDKK